MLKKLFMVLGVIICGLVLVGCNKTKDDSPEKMIKVEDANVKKQIVNYNFLYEFMVPGVDMPYNYMWEGHPINPDGEANLPEEKRTHYTYLTEYYEAETGYFAVYLKNSLLKDLKDVVKAYEDNNKSDEYNYHFSESTKEEIIDGKYLFAYQSYEKKNDSDLRFYYVEDFKDALYKHNDYQLVFCCKEKKASIKENLSTKEKINKNITLYKREELVFNDKNSSGEKYLFKTGERVNQTMTNLLFDYVGERMEVYAESYKNMEYGYYPVLGNGLTNSKEPSVRADIINVDNVKYVVLPRYELSGETKIDLLDNKNDFVLYEDVFGSYKEAFLNAYFKLSDNNTTHTEYGLYKYSAVKEILK